MKTSPLWLFICAILLCMDSVPVYAQPPAAQIYLPDSVFDFGFFAKDARVVHSYPIYNKGNDTLRIIKVQPGCGCTAAPLHKKNIAPGDSTFVDVFFDSKNMSGLVKKKLTLLSNDPVTPLREISFIALSGRPHPMVSVTPEVINFGRLSADKLDKSFFAKVTNTTKEIVELELVDFSWGYIKAELGKTSLKPGETTDLKLTLVRVPNEPEFYNFSATINAKSGEKDFRFSVPAVGRLNRVE